MPFAQQRGHCHNAALNAVHPLVIGIGTEAAAQSFPRNHG